MKKLYKILGALALSMALVSMPLLAVGCEDEDDGPNNGGDEAATLKVGFSICYTGKAAGKGTPMGDGKLDAIKYINEELGGVSGYQIEVVWRDNNYDASKATTIANELVDAGCLMVTTNSSAMMMATMEVLNRAEVPGMAVFSAPQVTNPPQHVYAQMPDYGDDWAAFAEYYMENVWDGVGTPKMALMVLNNSTGQGAVDAANLLAEDLGIEIVAIEEHTASTVSEIAALTSIMSENPDVIYISSTPQPTSVIVQNAVDMGIYPGVEIGVCHAGYTSALVELAGADNCEGIYGVYPTVNWGDDVPGMAKMMEYCLEYHPEHEGNLDYMTSWAEALIVAEMLRLTVAAVGVDNLTPQAVEQYGVRGLDGYDVEGLHGPVSYTAGDHRLSKSVRIFQTTGGQLVAITGWVDAPKIDYDFS